jgi:hypothetical protein
LCVRLGRERFRQRIAATNDEGRRTACPSHPLLKCIERFSWMMAERFPLVVAVAAVAPGNHGLAIVTDQSAVNENLEHLGFVPASLSHETTTLFLRDDMFPRSFFQFGDSLLQLDNFDSGSLGADDSGQ